MIELSDLSALHARAFAETGHRPWTEKEFGELLSLETTELFVARSKEDTENGEIQGFLLASFLGDACEVLTICVDSNMRRIGVAERLHAQLFVILQPTEMRRILVEVASTNSAARQFYHAIGYQEIGRRIGYYQLLNARIDAIVLEIAVPSGSVVRS